MFPLGQMPTFEFTEEMRRQAMRDAMRQAGLGMMGAALGGARTGDAMMKGLLGGVQSYKQAPMLAQKQMAAQLEAQKDWLASNKTVAELQKLSRESQQAQQQQDAWTSLLQAGNRENFLGQGNGPIAPNVLDQMGRQNIIDTAKNPQFVSAFGAAGGNIDQLKNFAGMYAPRKLDMNAMYENHDGTREHIPQLGQGMTFGPNGQIVNAPNYSQALYEQKQAEGMAGVLPDQLRQAFALNNAPVTNVKTGQQTRAGIDNPVIGLPQGLFPSPQPMSGRGVQVQLTPDEQAGQANLQKGNDLWREKTLTPTIESGAAARGVIDNLQALRGVDLSTGMGTELKGKFASFGAMFNVPGAEQYAGNVQRFQALAMESVNRELNQAKGPQTEGDAIRAKQIFASLSNVQAANEFLIDYRMAVARAAQAKAQFYEAAHTRALERGERNMSNIDASWRKISRSIWQDPDMQKWLPKK